MQPVPSLLLDTYYPTFLVSSWSGPQWLHRVLSWGRPFLFAFGDLFKPSLVSSLRLFVNSSTFRLHLALLLSYTFLLSFRHICSLLSGPLQFGCPTGSNRIPHSTLKLLFLSEACLPGSLSLHSSSVMVFVLSPGNFPVELGVRSPRSSDSWAFKYFLKLCNSLFKWNLSRKPKINKTRVLLVEGVWRTCSTR